MHNSRSSLPEVFCNSNGTNNNRKTLKTSGTLKQKAPFASEQICIFQPWYEKEKLKNISSFLKGKSFGMTF